MTYTYCTGEDFQTCSHSKKYNYWTWQSIW